MKSRLIHILRGVILTLLASYIFLHPNPLQASTLHASTQQAAAQQDTAIPAMPVNAFIELDVGSVAEMEKVIAFIESQGGNVPLSFAPQALFVHIPSDINSNNWDARADILEIHQGVATLNTDDPQAQLALTIWNQWQQEHPFTLAKSALERSTILQASQRRTDKSYEQSDHSQLAQSIQADRVQETQWQQAHPFAFEKSALERSAVLQASHRHVHQSHGQRADSQLAQSIQAVSLQETKQASQQSTTLDDCSNLAANRFPNANCFQTSEFFIGDFQVDLFLPESNENSSNSENWSPERRDEVVNGVASGLLWWIAASQQVGPAPDLSYNLTVHDPFISPEDVTTDYEPIQVDAKSHANNSEDQLWIGDLMKNVGYPGSTQYAPVPKHMVAMWRYVDARRQEMQRDWGFVVFVADSQNDEDGFFADDVTFAYAGRPGPHVVLTYDNGTNSQNIGVVNGIKINMVHEMGHIIDAPEEYENHCNPTEPSGYLHVLNSNCESGGDVPLEDSVMRSPLNQRIAFTTLSLPMSVRRMAGWQDSDGDGILDPVDTTPAMIIAGPSVLSDGRYRYSGRATDIAHSVPAGRAARNSRTPVTINTIVAAEYRIDNKSWQPCLFADDKLSPDASSGTFQCEFIAAEGQHTLAFRSRNSVGNYSEILVRTLDTDLQTAANTTPRGTLSLSGGDSNVLGTPTAHLVLSASDDQSLLDGGQYRLHYQGQWQEWNSYKGYVYTELDSGQADHDLSVQYRDGDGNISQEYATMLKLDMEPPTCEISEFQIDPDSTDVILKYSNNDQSSSVTSVNLHYYDENTKRYQWQGWTGATDEKKIAIEDDGTYTFTLRCRDEAYNQGQVSTQTKIDRTAPAGALQDVEMVWNDGKLEATLNFVASDNTTGITQYRLYYAGQWQAWESVDLAFTFAESALVTIDSTEGNHTFQVQFKDKAGNVSDIYRQDVEVSNKAPVGSIQDIEKSWQGEQLDAKIHFEASSTLGGINGYRLYYNEEWQDWEAVDIALLVDDSTTVTLQPIGDTHTIQIQFRDAYGNMSKIDQYDVQVNTIDRRGPTGTLIIGAIDPVEVGGNSAVGKAEVTLRISAQDQESRPTRMNIFDGSAWLGWEQIQATKDIEVTEGTYNFRIQFRDSADNVSKIISQEDVVVDTTSPNGSLEVTTTVISAGVARATMKLRIQNRESLDTLQMRLFYNDKWHAWETYSTAKTVTLERDGLHAFQAQFRDASQNTSAISTAPSQPVDTQPPLSWITAPLSGENSTKVANVVVAWDGQDPGGDEASGIRCYDVRFSTDEGATWEDMQRCITETSATLNGEPGQIYYLQVRAIDNAGNIGEYPSDASQSVIIEITDEGDEPGLSDTTLYLPIIHR